MASTISSARNIHPVIMCGGAGTRLWPTSVADHPKQFSELTGTGSLFQQTVLRARRLWPTATPLILTGAAQLHHVEAQLASIACTANILVEPGARDSGPAIAAAAVWFAQFDPDAIMVILASDHFISDVAGFGAAADRAISAASEGFIATLGIEPQEPSTAYGYIRPGEPLAHDEKAHHVAGFVEKPNRDDAERYRQSGFLWNSGIFFARAQVLVDAFEQYAAAIAAAARQSVAEATTSGLVTRLGSSFMGASKLSIDYAVMEKTDRAAVVPGVFGWSDLGSWSAVKDVSVQDGAGNAVHGDAVLLNSENNLIRAADGMTVAAIGIRNLAVVAEPGAVLVCDLASGQEVKRIGERMTSRSRSVVAPQAVNAAPSLQEFSRSLTLWLKSSALPLWWAVGADPRGGFHEALDINGEPVDKPRRARVQTRQVFVYAKAGQMGWRGPWRDAAEHGMDFFLHNYRRSDGLFRTLVAANGAPLDETATLYDQAFALLAMASLFEAAPDRTGLQREADVLRLAISATMRHPHGGFIEAGAQRFQANPHMHLLEAALAWLACDGASVWADLADDIVRLCIDHFFDRRGGFVREFFDSRWQPADGEIGRIVEPGHQFEWAWLLDRWTRMRSRPDAEAIIPRLVASGLAGVDPDRGVIVSELWDDLTMRERKARLWQQCEWLRAMLVGMPAATRSEHATTAVQALQRYLAMPVPGTWWDIMTPDGSFVAQPSPASSLYHLVGAVSELASVSGPS